MDIIAELKPKLKSASNTVAGIASILIRPNRARKKIDRLQLAFTETSRSLDEVSNEEARLEKENSELRKQVFALKAWIRIAHRLDKQTAADTIKAVLLNETNHENGEKA